jgi:hypothetical protein
VKEWSRFGSGQQAMNIEKCFGQVTRSKTAAFKSGAVIPRNGCVNPVAAFTVERIYGKKHNRQSNGLIAA